MENSIPPADYVRDIKNESSDGSVEMKTKQSDNEMDSNNEEQSLVIDEPVSEVSCGSNNDPNNNIDSGAVGNRDNDVIFEGSFLAHGKNELEYQIMYDKTMGPGSIKTKASQVEIDVRGIKYKIPYSVKCHLCTDIMYLCLRRTRYRGETREYPAYRCNRKGCQTFRSIRKVFSSQIITSTNADKNSQGSNNSGDSDKSTDPTASRINIPRQSKRNHQEGETSMVEKMKFANVNRTISYTEFTDQLRRDIAANKKVLKKRAKGSEENVEQGTLIYVTKELTSQEVVQLQDAIIQVLIYMRKMPTPLTMSDLPLFSHCPWSKDQVERGMVSEESRESFCAAFTKAPQPPIPEGFTRRSDDTLIYKNPEPYTVPEILQQNSPRRTAEAVVDYQRRKEELEVKKMEKRQMKAALKKKKNCLNFDTSSLQFDGPSTPKRKRTLTAKEMLGQMIEKGVYTGNIRISDKISEEDTKSLKWIDVEDDVMKMETPETCALAAEYDHRRLESQSSENSASSGYSISCEDRKAGTLSSINLHEMMLRSLSNPQNLISNAARFSMDPKNDAIARPTSPILFSGFPEMHSTPQNAYFANPAIAPQHAGFLEFDAYSYASTINQQIENGLVPQCQPNQFGNYINTSLQNGSGSPIFVNGNFTYIHPQSGVRVTDPSTFLTSFVPSPVVKNAPVDFMEEKDTKHDDSAPTIDNPDELLISHLSSRDSNLINSNKNDDDFKESDNSVIDSGLKFDPPNIDD